MKIYRRRTLFAALSAVAIVVSGFTIAGPAMAANLPEIEALSSQERALLRSDSFKTIGLDPATGEIKSVKASGVMAGPRAAHKNGCTAGRACWGGWLSPHALWGFSGKGVNTGTWNNRGNLNTGDRPAKACWVYAGNNACSTRIAKNSLLTWGVEIVGKSVTRY